MTELRKGQRVLVEAEVMSPNADDANTAMVRVVGADGYSTAVLIGKGTVHVSEPTYLARREAMVREMVASTAWEHTRFAQIVKAADDALRAIDETPVPEWAGGEHE